MSAVCSAVALPLNPWFQRPFKHRYSYHISFQGLVAEVTLQNSFHDVFLSFLIAAAYVALTF